MPAPAEVVITPADIAKAPSSKNAPRTAVPEIESIPLVIPQDNATKSQDAAPAATTPAQPAPELVLDPLGERLRDGLSATASNKLFDAKTRASVDSFYLARKYAPVWTANGVMNAQAKAVIAQLKHADADGLDPSDYPAPALEANAGPDALADFDLKLTDAVVTYARHAAVGRVHWSRVSRDIFYDIPAPEAADILGKLASASDARAALDSYNPQHEYYKALKAKLAEIRGDKDGAKTRIGHGPALKVGMQDPRVPDLRARLGVAGDDGNMTYDNELADAVRKFQKQKGLAANGSFTSATVDALNGPRNDRAADLIIANLERWRWIAHDLGPSHVIVNIPEFMLRLYNNGSQLWQTRVVVGKPSTPTPLLTETMKFITVNPTWNVPPSIVYGEYLPALRQDPTVLARMGLRVSYNRDGGVHISQPPGAGNALGRIRFNFPNKFSVYQHDTPDKHMFAHDRRAYSHGCMRVQNPDEYAAKLLSVARPDEHYTAERIRGMFGRGEVNIHFPTPIPVHLTYQTAYVDSAGKLVLREDVYGRDAKVLAALKTNTQYAETPVEQRRAASPPVRRQVYRAPVQQQQRGFGFFGLFR
jgi:murein L,D-transpeptidase YcbB/YkuD